ncbi:MAG: carboxypeptidase-like regulatory domain-containing protein [Chitinophagaceae bacterium]|nr:carboxypeptidase-like regulatory domain-containing protein [Chitinophagaceae bacterium]
MNNRQIAKYGMFHLVLTFCKRNIDIIKKLPAFGYAYNTFEAIVNTIDAAAPAAARKTTGPAAAKKQLRKNLQAKALSISSRLFAYAADKDDPALKEKISYTNRDLNRLQGEELAPVCKVILETATELLPEMADYNLTQARLDELNVLIQSYVTFIPVPQLEANDIRATARRIRLLFEEAEKVLEEKMDNLAYSIRDNEPDFYAGYTDSRKVTDAATRHTKVSGTVSEKSTGRGIAGVLVLHEVTGLTAVTNAIGEFQLAIPLAGDHTLLLQKTGYELTTAPVTLKRGQNSQVECLLDIAA